MTLFLIQNSDSWTSHAVASDSSSRSQMRCWPAHLVSIRFYYYHNLGPTREFRRVHFKHVHKLGHMQGLFMFRRNLSWSLITFVKVLLRYYMLWSMWGMFEGIIEVLSHGITRRNVWRHCWGIKQRYNSQECLKALFRI